MPIYSCTVKGEERAAHCARRTAAQAKGHIVDVKAMTADEMADAIENGATVEPLPSQRQSPPKANEWLGPPRLTATRARRADLLKGKI